MSQAAAPAISADSRRVVFAAAIESPGGVETTGPTEAPAARLVVCDALTGEAIGELPADGQTLALAYAEQGPRLAAAGAGALRVWDVEARQELARLYPWSDAAGPALFWGAESWLKAGDVERAASGYWDYAKRHPDGSYRAAADLDVRTRSIGYPH